MHDYIAISTFNDFIFYPYSIYLHNVYMGGDEELYHTTCLLKNFFANLAKNFGNLNNVIYICG